jgi:probable phosphoglycerate mutase
MILAIVRHGQTHFNANGFVQGRVNIHLNQLGKEQSTRLGSRLKNENAHFDYIASSPLSRALETAYLIKQELKYQEPIHVFPRLVERDFADLEGTPIETAMPLVRIPNYMRPGYENDTLMKKRIKKAVLDLEHRYQNKTILLVAHSHVIKALLIACDSEKYSFADFIGHTDIFYFEINHKKISFIKKEIA